MFMLNLIPCVNILTGLFRCHSFSDETFILMMWIFGKEKLRFLGIYILHIKINVAYRVNYVVS